MKVKVAMVSYKNTKPFLYGLENSTDFSNFELKLLHPAACSQAFANGDADIALVPVAFLEDRNDYKIITDYCIGSNGPVNSVAIFSESPIEDLSTIILDNHSLTSNRLVKILMEHYWKLQVNYQKQDVSEGVALIDKKTGVVMIGDKVFDHQAKYSYKYDLSEAWVALTKLPFVFAVWIAKPHVKDEAIAQLNEALAFGVNSIEEILKTNSYQHINLREYLTVNLEFNFSDKNKAGLDIFLNKYKLPVAAID